MWMLNQPGLRSHAHSFTVCSVSEPGLVRVCRGVATGRLGRPACPVSQDTPSRRRRQRLSVAKAILDHLINNLAELVKDSAFIVAVSAAEDQGRWAAHVALIFFRPFDNLGVACTGFHVFASAMA